MKYKGLTRILIMSASLFSSISLWAAPLVAEITADQWSRPRSASMLVQISSLKQMVQAFNRETDSVILIRYPGGEEGLLWANELKDWLVSLGIPSANMQMQSGHSDTGKISLILGN